MSSVIRDFHFLRNAWETLRSLATNKYFGVGLLILIGFLGAVYFLVDRLAMPRYVRYDVSIPVPDVRQLPIEEARMKLENLDFQVEVESHRYNPQLPRDVVVDQSPHASLRVKPGRRIYLTINTGATPEATVPSLEGISMKEALNRLTAAGLIANPGDIRPDSIPHPYLDMVTRQLPEAGTIVEEGSNIRLWYSTGLGKNYVDVPALEGMTIREARAMLLSRKLRSVVLGVGDQSNTDNLPVVRQSHTEGTRVREGSEIRLFVDNGDEENE